MVRIQWNDNLKFMGGHDLEPRFLYPTKLLLGQNNESFNMLRLRGFTAHINQGEKNRLRMYFRENKMYSR